MAIVFDTFVTPSLKSAALPTSPPQDSSCSVKGALRNQTCPHHDDRLGRAVSVAQAVVSQQSQAGVEEQRGRVPQVQERLHQGDGPHGPVAAQLRWIQQQPRIHGEKVVEGHLSCGGGTDCCWIIEPAKGAREQQRAGCEVKQIFSFLSSRLVNVHRAVVPKGLCELDS